MRSRFVDVAGLGEVDMEACRPDVVEPDTAVPPSNVDDTLSGSILPSLAQPPTMSPVKSIQHALFDRSINIPP
jgi:hypothetical protein